MKTKLFTILSALLLTAFVAPVIAEEGEAKGKRRPARGERPDVASMTAEEKLEFLKKRLEGNPKMAEAITKRFDADKSGTLSDTELTEAAKAMAKRGGKRRASRAGRRAGETSAEGEERGRGPRGKGKGRGRGKGPRGGGPQE
jgi:hypothetical protein